MRERKLWFLGAALAAAVSLLAAPGWAADLVAKRTKRPPKIDGKVDRVWSRIRAVKIPVFGGKIGKVTVSMKAMYDEEFIFFLVQWADKTLSQNRVYELRGGKWTKRKGNEDRLAIMFNIGESIADFNQAGCQVACHGGGKYMGTSKPGEVGDLWHWKAQRTNPVGYADDQWVQHEVKMKGHELTARKSDKKVGGSYSSNFDKKEGQPKYIGGGPVLLKANAKPYVGGAPEGTVVPREVLARPKGSRGDIDAGGVWKNGKWTLELRRKLNTGHKDDVVFQPGRAYAFGIAVFDNADGVEHSFSVGASRLILK